MAYQISGDCRGCGACAKKCPEHAIDGKMKERFEIDPFLCDDCGACFKTCQSGAVVDPKGNRSSKKGGSEKQKRARIETDFCAGCRTCFLNCPHDAIRVIKKNILSTYCHVDPEICLGCGICTQFCITGAVALKEHEQNSDQGPPPNPVK